MHECDVIDELTKTEDFPSKRASLGHIINIENDDSTNHTAGAECGLTTTTSVIVNFPATKNIENISAEKIVR